MTPSDTDNKQQLVFKLTALWGFSEAVMGGLLHALKLPVTGIFVGGFAVIIIALIAYYTGDRSAVFRATLQVILIKFLASPHTPPTAYLSVFLQGLIGMLFVNIRKNYLLYCLYLSVITMVFSALQKLIFTTLFFGAEFWEALDIYMNFIVGQFSHAKGGEVSFSYIIIISYVSVHAVFGLITGFISYRLPVWMEKASLELKPHEEYLRSASDSSAEKKAGGRSKRKYKATVFITIITLILLQQFLPLGEAQLLKIIIRSLIMFVAWFFAGAPLLSRLLRKVFQKRIAGEREYFDTAMNMFPVFRRAFSSALFTARNEGGRLSFRKFIAHFIHISVLMN